MVISVEFINSGQTPAKALTYSFLVGFLPEVTDTSIAKGVAEAKSGPSEFFPTVAGTNRVDVVKDGTFKAAKEIEISQHDLDDALAGREILVALGTVNYADMFGSRHTTQFCRMFSPFTNRLHFCPVHNSVN
jgi:hypothetical protein